MHFGLLDFVFSLCWVQRSPALKLATEIKDWECFQNGITESEKQTVFSGGNTYSPVAHDENLWTLSRSGWLKGSCSVFLKLRSGCNVPYRGLIYEFATCRASRGVGGWQSWLKVRSCYGQTRHGSTRDAGLETSICLEGCTVIFVGSRYFCLLGSLSPKRILKVMFYCCVPIKVSIIQARVIMTYSLLYLLFSSGFKEIGIQPFLWLAGSVVGPWPWVCGAWWRSWLFFLPSCQPQPSGNFHR